MGIKRHRPEEIVTKLRQVEVLVGQGMARIDAIREVCITEQTFYRWRKQYGGMGTAQLKELNHLITGVQGDISILSLKRAIGWQMFLLAHAKRAYAAVTSATMDSAASRSGRS